MVVGMCKDLQNRLCPVLHIAAREGMRAHGHPLVLLMLLARESLALQRCKLLDAELLRRVKLRCGCQLRVVRCCR